MRSQAAEALPRLVLAVWGAHPPPPGATGAAAIVPQVRAVLDVAVRVSMTEWYDAGQSIVRQGMGHRTACWTAICSTLHGGILRRVIEVFVTRRTVRGGRVVWCIISLLQETASGR